MQVDSPVSTLDPLDTFHPIVRDWFRSRFEGPTEPQERAWPSIAAGRRTLVAAPTGSGKTLTAFLACIDRLLKRGRDIGGLPDAMSVVYVSPLRALSNDMHRNLSEPLVEIAALAAERGVELPEVRVGLRTGDTSNSRRAALVRRPPHILVTTPESLYLLLTSERGRAALATTETLIVDEIHALVRDKRGSHLALSMERLEHLVADHGGRPLQRIGLSATQKPIDVVAEFLCGSRVEGQGSRGNGLCETLDTAIPRPSTLDPRPTSPCDVHDVGHARELDLAIETPPSDLGAICSYEQWDEINARLVELINEHRSTLIFVNTRRLAERVTFQLTELLGEEAVGAHHGSLAAEKRHTTERRLKNGELRAVVATASLELGLDVGFIDLVVQLGSPRSIATFLQRIGRSGHALGLVPKGRLFALTRDELVEAMALVRAVRSGRLDALHIPRGPLDVLAQQIVAEAAARECDTDELFDLYRRSYPYRELPRKDFDDTLEYLSEGIANHNGRSKRYLHHDRVNGRIRARKGAGIVALSNGGAIAEIASFRVVAEPEGIVVGTLDEDFATESSRGDIFLLGNTSWRFEGLRGNDVMVTDAHGAPPTIPFWRGEAPGRTMELSEEVSRLRFDLERHLTPFGRDPQGSALVERALIEPTTDDDEWDSSEALPCGSRLNGNDDIVRWLIDETSCSEHAAEQIVEYAAAELGAIGLLPTQDRVVFERFFDDTGGMQLVVHAPFGGNVCRAWGYAMRKRFCRSFDFELQATADDDGFILSLGPQHSFPIESLFPMLTPENARGLLEQAVLTVPVWEVRWRWNVQRALLVERMRHGKKVPPALQRFRADDLLTAVFPKLTGCQEEHTGDHEVPDHPLTNQTMHDALTETLDIDGLEVILGRIRAGEIQLIARDTREPSPFAYELLNANPYAFLDGGEAAERRTRAVATRRSFDPDDVRNLTALDPHAIDRVVREAQPPVRNADELHDLLLTRIVVRSRVEGRGSRDTGTEDSPEGATACSPGREPRVDTVPTQVEPRRGDVPPRVHAAPSGLASSSSIRSRGSRPGLHAVVPSGLAPDSAHLDRLAAGRRAGAFAVGERTFWVAAERLPIARAAFGAIVTDPPLEVPRGVAIEVSAVEARVAIVRGHVETSGPVTAEEIADEFGFPVSQVESALEAIEGEGVVLRGHFRGSSPVQDSQPSTLNTQPIQWCHRRLLARIHRLTLQGLREQIEPVGLDVLQRFLFRHHGVVGRGRTGANGLHEVVQMLQGIDVPAICWERDLLRARLRGYQPEWLDELCLTGEVGWARLYPPRRDDGVDDDNGPRRTNVTKVVPVSLFLREDLGWLRSESRGEPSRDHLDESVAAVLERLVSTGARFANDLASELRLRSSQLSDVLGELVARGLVTADGFAGLRSLVGATAARERRPNRLRGFRPRVPEVGVGRWSLRELPASDGDSNPSSGSDDGCVEAWAWQLLRRWGVVFRELLDRESGAPRWWRLLQYYRRAEARGEVRGGRFVSGVGGEQYALPHVVEEMRRLRDESNEERPADETIIITAADPLNLTGIVGRGERVPATASNRVAYVDGFPVAALVGGEVRCRDESRFTPDVADRLLGRVPVCGDHRPVPASATVE